MSRITLPLTFRAVGSPAPGTPLEPLTRTIQSLQADEVLARVSYSSINAMDGRAHQAKINFFQLPLPLVFGFDFSGVVVALGTEGAYPGETEALTVGSAVMGSTFGIGWGGGCFAEYVVAKRERVSLRGDIPEPDASTYNIAYFSAYEPLCMEADIKSRAGQTIFIPGGAGGVGHFAVQLAKAHGLRVITSASKPAGMELLHKLRADVVIDYSKQDVVAEVMKATNDKGADLVFEATYVESSMKQSASVVAKGGQWMRLGTWLRSTPEQKQELESIVAGRGATVLLGDLGRYARDPVYVAKIPQLMEGHKMARQLYAEGLVRPYITATVPLEAGAMNKALQDSLTSLVGKWVVKVQ